MSDINVVKAQAIAIGSHILNIKGAYMLALETMVSHGVPNADAAYGTLDEFGVWDRAIVDECDNMAEAQQYLDGAKKALGEMFRAFATLNFA